MANLKSRAHIILEGELIQVPHSTLVRSNSPLRIGLKFKEVLTTIVAVVGSSQTGSMPSQVQVRYLDKPATPTTPVLVPMHITIAAKYTVEEQSR